MSWLMTVAAGAALGYFLVQYFTKNGRVPQETEGAAEETEARAASPARLHKSSRDKKVAGVCGGIAEYLHADPTIVRLAAVVLMFGWGSGLLAYIICAIVLPEE